ncbi:hypothetical protein Golax_000716, partial [Gossypium laxum]|nr:hypothetical protein [Gossypium laxum]
MVVIDGGDLARENGFPGLRSVGGHVTKKVTLREDESPNEGEADVLKETVRGLPTIKFSKRVYELVHQSMMRTIALKLLGRSIGFNTLSNKLYLIGKPKDNVEEVAKVPIKEPSMEYKVAMKDYGSWM